MKTILKFLLILCLTYNASAQKAGYISGKVLEIDSHGHIEPLEFVNVYYVDSQEGLITGSDGSFSIRNPLPEDGDKLVFSYMGYKQDTIIVKKEMPEIELVMKSALDLQEVTLVKRKKGEFVSRLNTLPTQVTTEAGLQKLACCNIGESFENSATVDVGYADAVSGARKIRMLGLDGKYSQFLYENIPSLRGLESSFGLSHIPGPFMESIQVSKGTSSVLNGYESTTGQINVEFKKPDNGDKLFVNLFANTEGRYESNFTSAQTLNEHWSTNLLFHASTNTGQLDHNNDGFLDVPLSQQLNFHNRWKYSIGENLHAQFGVEVLDELRDGGQIDYKNSPLIRFGIGIDLQKFRLYGKLGYASPTKPYESIGWINSFTWFDQKSKFGQRIYNGNQKSYLSNLIWQTIISNTNHQISSGLSVQYDEYSEFFIDTDYIRKELVTGIFSQYTFTVPEKMVLMAGSRLDYNSEHGILFTPRLHLKYDLTETLIGRFTAGRSFRTANAISENMSYLVSSRLFVMDTDFNIEQALNAGINLTQHIHFGEHREGTFSLDYYRTEFINQLVTDLDHSVNQVNLYNLDGRSYSTSVQAEFGAEVIKRLELTLAYRFNEVIVNQLDGMMEKPFVVRNKGLFSTTYSTRFEKWKIDLNIQYNGSSRLPETKTSPSEYQLPVRSPSYFIAHTQLTRKFKWVDIYAGIENLTNYMQKNPIISADIPYGDYFDASMIYAPVTGRMYYVGLRFRIK
jgi:outer membrane cobalamin receptor